MLSISKSEAGGVLSNVLNIFQIWGWVCLWTLCLWKKIRVHWMKWQGNKQVWEVFFSSRMCFFLQFRELSSWGISPREQSAKYQKMNWFLSYCVFAARRNPYQRPSPLALRRKRSQRHRRERCTPILRASVLTKDSSPPNIPVYVGFLSYILGADSLLDVIDCILLYLHFPPPPPFISNRSSGQSRLHAARFRHGKNECLDGISLQVPHGQSTRLRDCRRISAIIWI